MPAFAEFSADAEIPRKREEIASPEKLAFPEVG
jgi:hypothetical protein